METWEEHRVTFASEESQEDLLPAEGLEKNETSVRVLDEDQSDDMQE